MRASLAALLLMLPLALLPSRARSQISPGPLARAHAELDGARNCTQCHSVRREPMSRLCLECHRDIAQLIATQRGLHGREAGERAGRKECASCHPDHAGRDFNLVSWSEGSPARFDHRRASWPLDGRHADVACEKCHTAEFRSPAAAALSKRRSPGGWVGLETSCASCHRTDDPHRGALGGACQSCHDARGWKPASGFDHARTKYPLTGKHATVSCDACHLSPRVATGRDAKGERIPVYKPLPFAECSGCHADPHAGRMTGTCRTCHTTRGFDAVDRGGFNHALTRYPLRGRHAAVACAGCHGDNMAKRDPPFATCASCHTDPHGGEATLNGGAADCASCHRVEGFTPSTFTVAQHRTTSYPLEGKHQTVACASCHTTTMAAGGARRVRMRPPYETCATCHADAHGGQLAGRTDKGACEACHGPAGWTPSTFTAAAHDALRVPLRGRHGAIACAACHAAARPGLPAPAAARSLGTAQVLVRPREVECASCHVDPHAGRFAANGAAPAARGCQTCHGFDSFRPALVDVAAHGRFTFPLEGAHRAVPCTGCHAEMKAAPATSTLVARPAGIAQFAFAPASVRTCATCHESPHGAQFDNRPRGAACESCHGVDSFAPAARFDHDRDSAFPLRGAHERVACASCHRSETTSSGPRRMVYRPLPEKCESCHARRPARETT